MPYLVSTGKDDHATPYREDYSINLDVELGSIMTESGEALLTESDDPVDILHEAAVGGFVMGTGANFNLFQETMEPFALTPRMGRYTQLEVTNTTGQIKINQATLTNQQGDRTIAVKS